MERRYFKPRSLTWWASIVPVAAGLFLAFEPVHQITSWAQVIRSIAGETPPAVLINAGLAGIGLRGALGK